MMTPLQKTAQLHEEIRHRLLNCLDRPCIQETAIRDFLLARRDDAAASESCFERPLAGLVVQGTKHSVIGGREYVYTEGQSIVSGIDVPITSHVENPSREHPFLFLYIYLDRALIASLVEEMQPPVEDSPEEHIAGVSIADTEPEILEVFLRMLDLLEKPEQIAIRAPLMLRELHYLLIVSPHGDILRRLNTPGTRNNQVVQAVNWIRANYRMPLRIDSLAQRVNMSTANLHRRFKLLTGLSPLQYQKQLRLHEARRLMLFENERVSDAAFTVGYESITQFNREYKRIFGEPPLRDTNRRRAASGV